MKSIKGDLIKLAKQGQFDVIVHGCNCFNSFGKGIALTIKKEFPEAYAADCKTVKGDRNKIGTYTGVVVMNDVGGELGIINAYTQYGYWEKKDLFEYEGFQRVLDDFASSPQEGARWGFPLIGCGLAGGDKERILKMIENTLAGMDVTVVEYEKG